jgi:hypothetical protein
VDTYDPLWGVDVRNKFPAMGFDRTFRHRYRGSGGSFNSLASLPYCGTEPVRIHAAVSANKGGVRVVVSCCSSSCSGLI